jgi:hypothetical protein
VEGNKTIQKKKRFWLDFVSHWPQLLHVGSTWTHHAAIQFRFPRIVHSIAGLAIGLFISS